MAEDQSGDEPVKFVESERAATPVDFDAEEVVDDLGMWWKAGGGNQFVLGSDDRGWAIWPEQAVIDKMRADRQIAIKAREGEWLSEAKQVFLWTRENRCLDEIFPALPGYQSGVYRLKSGERVMVKTSPNLIEPEEGEWDTIRALIDRQLDLSEKGDVDQTPWFFSWCKIALEALRGGNPGRWRQGHSMFIVGPAGSGKSRLQENLITPLLGGREADPEKFLFGKDDFNGDCFAAEHLAMGEIPSSQRTVDRVELSERIKRVVANSMQRMRLMRTEPWTVHPYWRLTISCNDDPDKLRSLPLITPDIADKILIFHTSNKGLPMPTNSIEEREAFCDAIEGELPAFVHFLLNEWEIPDELLTYEDGRDATRFGFREFHHPVIKDGLFDETPAAELLTLIDMAEFVKDGISCKLWDLPAEYNERSDGGAWAGRAVTLEQMLKGDSEWTCTVESHARDLFRHNKAATLLSRLNAHADIGGVRIDKDRGRTWKGWAIARPSAM